MTHYQKDFSIVLTKDKFASCTIKYNTIYVIYTQT